MRSSLWSALLVPAALLTLGAAVPQPSPQATVVQEPDEVWKVDDIRPGMKGVGKTVMKGTKVEPFEAEVIGVLKNTSPGRDMILCRLSGLGLEKTGVIAGMSGSPIHIDGKLMGAVAYAWPFQKEGQPIAGVTPYCQMKRFADRLEQRVARTRVSAPEVAKD